MWLITNFGCYSIVKKPADDWEVPHLTVRARVRSDIEDLRDRYLPTLEPIIENAGTDYKYRAKVPQIELASALRQVVLDIDYGNFKDSVHEHQGTDRSKLYHELWEVLHRLHPPKGAKAAKSGKMSYGGVLLKRHRGERQILLRRPKGDFDGYVWTFPKGRQEPDSTPEETALREVKDETGYTAEILGRIPGRFQGGTGITEYFLMNALGEPEAFDKAETRAIAWVSLDEAPKYIEQTKNVIGRQRDQSVLKATTNHLATVATRFSRDIHEMPARSATIPFRMRFSPGEVARLSRGIVPEEMEDKWFIFLENGWLNFHRSWTGNCVFRLRLEPDGDCFRVAETWANRDPDQYEEDDPAVDEWRLLSLLHGLFAIGSEAGPDPTPVKKTKRGPRR